MKKIILSILFGLSVFFFVSLTVPTIVGAATGNPAAAMDQCNIKADNLVKLSDMGVDCDPSGVCKYSSQLYPCGACCILSAILNLTDWIFVGLIAISALMIIYGAYLFVMAGQDPGKADKGKNLLMYAAIGIAIAFFSRALPSMVKMMIGV